MTATGSTVPTVPIVIRLHYPWPPANPYLLCRNNYDNQQYELIALNDGRIQAVILPAQLLFISQPIDINCNGPRFVILTVQWTGTELKFFISGQELLRDAPGVPLAILPAETFVSPDLSLNEPNTIIACQKWIQNRRVKFSKPHNPRAHRQLKTTEQQASDLRVSVLRLRHLRQQVLDNKPYLLGTLAGEIRASIYWREGTDSDPNLGQNNPLLLRMANMADLPLPVYYVPENPPAPPEIAQAIQVMAFSDAPRVVRMFATDQVQDLQESLVSTVLRLGPSPGKTINARDLVKELAVTMGSAHYDYDVSDFLEVLEKLTTAQGNQVNTLMLQIADTVAELSVMVLSELKNRNLIG
jgi:hypothetical protein